MRAKELRERTDEELKNLLVDAKNNLFQSRIKNATHQLTDSSQIKKNRREIARINTILGERSDSAKQE
ncbi:MAG: 50S ribosomal protein L29 [Deltaproteobacteria bacterium]|nr:50S ribosomal protein L29 [Deltaproteobacteria bacterium]